MTDQETLELWQNYKASVCAEYADAMLHEFFQTPLERTIDEAVRNAMEEMDEEECFFAHVAQSVGELQPEHRIDIAIECLDMLIEQARAGKVSKEAAKQIHLRAEEIYAAVALPAIKVEING